VITRSHWRPAAGIVTFTRPGLSFHTHREAHTPSDFRRPLKGLPASGNMVEQRTGRVDIAWNGLCCQASRGGADTHILRHVSGYAHAGHITAVMGQSGSGKTTLVRIVSVLLDCRC
jgi:ABC-type multidrug transport system fused ATPase/permease subunit